MSSVMLTTIDNPFNPFIDFNSWLNYDLDKGYGTCAYLDRIAKTSDQLSDEENEKEIERAIDTIVDNDFMDIYIKIKENDPKNSRNQ